ncbi:hypothetical protein D9758_016453 [Tetrapyrgos nigripes]|uniref:Uncharacterized protein n=1 Tax=Tetrapyrgos nigripes TaxID=182062 RepID=A0A8H5CE15_9AGAR|nr:hypothetical protein D9758_016453 [Tetrapyrgos nigripes]
MGSNTYLKQNPEHKELSKVDTSGDARKDILDVDDLEVVAQELISNPWKVLNLAVHFMRIPAICPNCCVDRSSASAGHITKGGERSSLTEVEG